MENNPFQRKEKPDSAWELFRWMFFEPELLVKYSDSLTRKETIIPLLKSYVYIVILTVLLYTIFSFLFPITGLIDRFPDQFKKSLLTGYQSQSSYLDQVIYFWNYGKVGLGEKNFFVGWNVGLGIFIGFIFGFLWNYFYSYPLRLVQSYKMHTLSNNPYLLDATIFFPLPIDKKFPKDCFDDPETGDQFCTFLFQYRPRQRKLAYLLWHSSIAGRWNQNPLEIDIFDYPSIDKEDEIGKQFALPEDWKYQFDVVKSELEASITQTEDYSKLDACKNLVDSLKKLEQLTVQFPPSDWKEFYLIALRKWVDEAEKQYKQELDNRESNQKTCRDPFSAGYALNTEKRDQVFMGRDNVKMEIESKIRSSKMMPTFFLQGQRRIGKTSFLKYFQLTLGSGFYLLFQDMQSKEESHSLADKFNKFRVLAELQILKKETSKKLPTDPLIAWKELSEFLLEVQKTKHRKIILAMDEYETFHKHLHNAGEEVYTKLLDSMRSFSQHQNQVIFLFSGLLFFSDLKEPNLNEYFPHVEKIQLDYLNRSEVIQLYTKPYPDYTLKFDENALDYIYEHTMGHPYHVQEVGSKLVTRANQTESTLVKVNDAKVVLKSIVQDSGNNPIELFWNAFCTRFGLHETVKEILQTGSSQNKTKLLILEDYKFIREVDGKLRLSSPLFEDWILRNGERVL